MTSCFRLFFGGYWDHIREVLKLNLGLKVACRLTDEHVELSYRSRMKVDLAVQTLSATNAGLLRHYVAKIYPDAVGTAEFCSIMNKFFDVMNVRNPKETGQKNMKSTHACTQISMTNDLTGWSTFF